MTLKVRLFFLTFLTLSIGVTMMSAQDIVAHRGASHTAPENTLAAFLLAWDEGADAIEGDFRLTKDGHIVCLHDEDFTRTAKDKRRVDSMTLEEVRKLEVGSWKHKKYAEERVPTLDEVLFILPADKKLFLEVKCGPEIVPVLQSAKLKPEQIVIISFDRNVIAASRKALPNIKAHWLTSYKDGKPNPQQVLQTLAETKASGLDTKADPHAVTEGFVKTLREHGYEFHCWTVNDLALAKQFRELGVDSITTDRPGWLRDQLAK